MTKFASMIYKMIHFTHAVVEKMFFGHLVRLRHVALWVTLPSLRQQFLFRAVAHNPRAASCTCSCSIRQNWMERQDNVQRRCSAFTLNFFSNSLSTSDAAQTQWKIFFSHKLHLMVIVQFSGRPRKLFFHSCTFSVCATACEESVVVEQRGPIPNSFTITLKINFNQNVTCFSWEASGGRVVQLRLSKSHSKVINVGTVLYSRAFVQYWTN